MAKSIIYLINRAGHIINTDPEIGDLMKVV